MCSYSYQLCPAGELVWIKFLCCDFWSVSVSGSSPYLHAGLAKRSLSAADSLAWGRMRAIHPSACFSFVRISFQASFCWLETFHCQIFVVWWQVEVFSPRIHNHPLVFNFDTRVFDQLASSLFLWVSLSASQTQGFMVMPIVFVPRNVKSTCETYLTCSMLVTSLVVFSGFQPKATYPSSDFWASRWSTCLVSPTCMCTWSVAISRSICPLLRWNFVFGRSRSSGKCDIFTAWILSLMLWTPIALMEKRLFSSKEVSCTLYSFVFIISSLLPTLVMVMEISFPFKPRISAVSWQIRPTWAPSQEAPSCSKTGHQCCQCLQREGEE